jgi:hypothetical protein
MIYGGNPLSQSSQTADAYERASDGTTASVKLLNSTHPEYASRISSWSDLALLFEAGNLLRASCERMLRKRPREDADVFAERVRSFTYTPILGPALRWYSSAMFNVEPEYYFNATEGSPAQVRGRDGVGRTEQPFYTNFLSNCDSNELNFSDFLKRAFINQLIYGSVWVLTDLPVLNSVEDAPQNLKQQRERGLLDPHLVMYTPNNVINWQEDSRGSLEWAVVKVTTIQQNFLEDPTTIDRWYYYDREFYRIYEDRRTDSKDTVQVTGVVGENRKAKLIGEGRHALANQGRVPIRKLELSDGLWLANNAYLLLLDHMNQDNSLAWALFMSNLAMPVIIGDVDTTNMTAGETSYYQFPAGTTYQWSEPEGKSFQQSAMRLESLREEAYRSMHLQAQGRSMHATPAMQSGRSKVVEMVPAHEVLTAMGSDLRAQAQSILVDVRDARGDNSIEPDVRGFTFDDDMTAEEVFAVSSVLAMNIPSKTFEKYILQKVAKAWMRSANPSQIREVYKQIQDAPTLAEAADADLKRRIAMVKSGMGQALTSVNSPNLIKVTKGGGAPPVANKAPGQGGSDNSAISRD